MSVWIITSGEYSDYCVIGYCTTEEQAKRVCAFYNTDKLKYSDPCEYRELECMDGEAPNASIMYQYGFLFERKGNTWCLWATPVDKRYVLTVEKKTSVTFANDCNFSIGDKRWFEAKRAVVTVSIREPDLELAKKAAQDALYEKLAEVQGVV